MIRPQDNFRVFVTNNYERAQGVTELAALAGMSLSVFKRRFAEHFNDSVYHWMMQQKAQKIYADIRDGENSTRSLMNNRRPWVFPHGLRSGFLGGAGISCGFPAGGGADLCGTPG